MSGSEKILSEQPALRGIDSLKRFPIEFRSISPRLRILCGALFLFALNAWVCRELFNVEFTERMESIESSYMAISHWAARHWGDLSWFPLWFSGTPFFQVYQPGFHLTVAALETLTGWTTQHAYHFIAALEYCLGPVTLFLLCSWLFRSPSIGMVAGLLYSIFSPASFLIPAVRYDTGSLLIARRFIVLVRYGEGPHTAAVMILPLALLSLHYAVSERRWWGIPAAAVSLAVVPLTNWPGTMGLCMAIAAYALYRIDSTKRVAWRTFLGVSVIAYLLACPWIPPAILATVQRNAHQSDNTVFTAVQLGVAVGMVAILFLLGLWMKYLRVESAVRFFTYFAAITGTISIGHDWFGWHILPQAHRFQMEFEMAASGLAAAIGVTIFKRLPRGLQPVVIAAFLMVCGTEAVHLRHYAKTQDRPIDITQRVEYRMAKWFDSRMDGHRVYAPGNVSLWMNMFTDTPQMGGCCDQGMPSQEYRISSYTIYTGQNAGTQDAAVSILWLKAFGNDAIGVSGPKSEESFHPFWHPSKFEGVLPVMWRSGDNAIYDVQRRSRSLAHVVERSSLVLRAPDNGLDVAPLVPYVQAIESPDAPTAALDWLGTHKARVTAHVPPGRVLSVQITYDPAWHATVAGKERSVTSDALGLMVVKPDCTGRCVVDLNWDNHSHEIYLFLAAFSGALLLAGWTVYEFRARPNYAR